MTACSAFYTTEQYPNREQPAGACWWSVVRVGQVKTDEASNEITAIPKLLEILHLEGCIVTIDAIGCQREIVMHIIDKGADYVISLKMNQPALHAATVDFFAEAKAERFETVPHKYTETLEKEHGRFQTDVCSLGSCTAGKCVSYLLSVCL